MKKLILIMLALPLLAGCKKEEEKPKDLKCYLSEVRPDRQDHYRQYFYDENGRIEKTQDIKNGLHDEYSLYHFDGNTGRLHRVEVYEKDNSSRKTLYYTYRPDGKVSKISKDSRAMYDEETTFEYNAQGQLIKETVSINGDMIEYSNFTYGPNRVKLETFNYVHAPRGTKEYFFDERPNPLAQTGIVATGNFNNDRNYSELIPMPNNVIQYIETEFNGDTTGNSYTAHINFNEKGAATYKYLNYRYSPSGSVEYRYECK